MCGRISPWATGRPRRPSSTPRVYDHRARLELVGGQIARLGRRGLPVAARPAHAGHRAQVGHVLPVVDLVEWRPRGRARRPSGPGTAHELIVVPSWRASIAHMARVGAALVVMMRWRRSAELRGPGSGAAEPIPNTPVGDELPDRRLCLHALGDVAFDASTPIEDAELTAHSAYLAYAHAFGVWGRSAKLDIVLPYAWVSGHRRGRRAVGGIGTPTASGCAGPLLGSLYGGPALTMAEFADYKPDLIVGASLAVTAPDSVTTTPDKLVNIGTNRWSVKPRARHLPDVRPGDARAGTERHVLHGQQRFPGRLRSSRSAPLYAVQGHVIYHTRFGLWASLWTPPITGVGARRSTV